MRRRYRFHHMLFFQEELTFAEDGAVREILGRMAGAASPEMTLAGLLDTVYSTGIAEALFAVILKPYQPTVLHAMWNRYWSWYHNIPLEGTSVLRRLKNSQAAEVLSDFFVLNTSWMSAFSGIVNSLGGTPSRVTAPAR